MNPAVPTIVFSDLQNWVALKVLKMKVHVNEMKIALPLAIMRIIMEIKMNSNRKVALKLCLWFAMDVAYDTR